jgi:hypothetical protein|tara:strand:- start:1021 stop:1296 length:276 start_codon:yes stop_codon:yes gene_type:complete
MKMFKAKKGAVEDFLPLITTLVAVGITLVIGFLIMSEIGSNSTVSADPNATAAVSAVQNAMQNIPNFLPIVVITVIGVILLGLVLFLRRNT